MVIYHSVCRRVITFLQSFFFLFLSLINLSHVHRFFLLPIQMHFWTPLMSTSPYCPHPLWTFHPHSVSSWVFEEHWSHHSRVRYSLLCCCEQTPGPEAAYRRKSSFGTVVPKGFLPSILSPSWQWGSDVSSRYNDGSRKLWGHTVGATMKQWKWIRRGEVIYSQSSRCDMLSPAKSYHLNLPNSITDQRLRVKMPEPVEDVSLSNHCKRSLPSRSAVGQDSHWPIFFLWITVPFHFFLCLVKMMMVVVWA